MSVSLSVGWLFEVVGMKIFVREEQYFCEKNDQELRKVREWEDHKEDSCLVRSQATTRRVFVICCTKKNKLN